MSSYIIRELIKEDYESLIAFWKETPRVRLSDADSEDGIGTFLIRNNGMSFVAELEDKIIGTILCGHDGRRGFIYHLAVHYDYQRRGIGRRLVNSCLLKLNDAGIMKCNLFVLADNSQGMEFWESVGFNKRKDIYTFSANVNS